MGEEESDCYGSMGHPSARRAEAAGNPCAARVAAAAAELVAVVELASAAAVAAAVVELVVDGGRECACWAMRWNYCSLSGLRGMVRGRVVG